MSRTRHYGGVSLLRVTAGFGGCQQSGRPCDWTAGIASPSRVAQVRKRGLWARAAGGVDPPPIPVQPFPAVSPICHFQSRKICMSGMQCVPKCAPRQWCCTAKGQSKRLRHLRNPKKPPSAVTKIHGAPADTEVAKCHGIEIAAL